MPASYSPDPTRWLKAIFLPGLHVVPGPFWHTEVPSDSSLPVQSLQVQVLAQAQAQMAAHAQAQNAAQQQAAGQQQGAQGQDGNQSEPASGFTYRNRARRKASEKPHVSFDPWRS